MASGPLTASEQAEMEGRMCVCVCGKDVLLSERDNAQSVVMGMVMMWWWWRCYRCRALLFDNIRETKEKHGKGDRKRERKIGEEQAWARCMSVYVCVLWIYIWWCCVKDDNGFLDSWCWVFAGNGNLHTTISSLFLGSSCESHWPVDKGFCKKRLVKAINNWHWIAKDEAR